MKQIGKQATSDYKFAYSFKIKCKTDLTFISSPEEAIV
jgi:hypothetical protein